MAVLVVSSGHVLGTWAALLAALLFAAVLVVHLSHMRGVGWPLAVWHAGHVLMAAGMVLMNLPWLTIPPLLAQGGCSWPVRWPGSSSRSAGGCAGTG
ncbi:hypothetical protein [Sciscionella sediminilitoris]|uniref:hypothetical protein n=1 Tax=Sciscionella sediminilitoris TaxID=1445613 RepID=UPI0004DF1D15|nr:hypothetical protein [Sciscionella sp. SE31]